MDAKTMDQIDAADASTSWALNPWRPMTIALDLKHLGKLAEETNELGAAISRCIIQGIDECEPVTRKPNREWLQDEIADVLANIELVATHFGLDANAIRTRAERKKAHLRGWHSMIGGGVDMGEEQ
jgi:NTP pyrophosphatase (non-canonical NTP hydrolase)